MNGWLVFVVAAFVLAVTPGPAVLYIVTRSVTQGRRAGLASCLGLVTGAAVQVLAVVLGVSALLVASARAFTVVKYAGGLYLIWLGIRQFSDPSTRAVVEPLQSQSFSRVFRDGVVVNVLNVSTIPFLLTFLPQFVEPARGAVLLQLAGLGAAFLLIGLGINLTWSLLASAIRPWLVHHPQFAASQRYVAGAVYCGLGLATTLSGSART